MVILFFRNIFERQPMKEKKKKSELDSFVLRIKMS